MYNGQVQEFEGLDQLFFGRLFEVPVTTTKDAYYLEYGVMPINFVLISRRINYLQSILKQDETGMLYTVFLTSLHNP